jgi:hypothetical protein
MKQQKTREYYLEKISRIIFLINIENKSKQLKQEDTSLLMKVLEIFIEEEKTLSDKSNKLNKDKKKYLEKIIKGINKIDTEFNEYIDNELENFLSNINDKKIDSMGLKFGLLSSKPINKQLSIFLMSYLFDNDSILLSKQIDYKGLGYIYSSIINYNIDILANGLIDNNWISEDISNILFTIFPQTEERISDIDKENFELIISKYKNKIKELYIIANDDLYNELEQKVLDNPELVKRENFPKLGAILKELKEKFLSQPNIDENQRIYLKYRN